MRTYLLIACGAVLGANARYLVSQWAARRWPSGFPYGTLIVNVTGSFILGLLSALVGARFPDASGAQLLIGTGFCGAFTTFSTFAYESVALAKQAKQTKQTGPLEQRDRLPVLANVGASVVLCVGAAALGVVVAGAVAGFLPLPGTPGTPGTPGAPVAWPATR
jgi:CrcB protein